MRARTWLLAGAAALWLGVAAPAGAKTRAEMVNPHCVETVLAGGPGRLFRCGFEGFGKFEIDVEARLRKGAPDATAQLAILVDGHPCGRSDPVAFSGRQTIDQACSVQEVGLDRHEFTVSLDLRNAEYGGMTVNVVRRLKGPRKPGR